MTRQYSRLSTADFEQEQQLRELNSSLMDAFIGGRKLAEEVGLVDQWRELENHFYAIADVISTIETKIKEG